MRQRHTFGDELIMTPLKEGITLQRDGDRMEGGTVKTNVPHHVVHHSPDGYEWGYGGSGPADLALNIAESALHALRWKGSRTECFDGTCFELAWILHQPLKWRFIADVPDQGDVIPWEWILDWVKAESAKAGYQLAA